MSKADLNQKEDLLKKSVESSLVSILPIPV